MIPGTILDNKDRTALESSNKNESKEEFQDNNDAIKNDVEFLHDKVPQLQNFFNISCKIGSGTFSSVYLAKLKTASANSEQERNLFALKHIIPTSHPTRIENELRCLKDIGGRDNIIGLSACIRHKDHIVIIMPYFPHDKFQDYVRDLSLQEIQLYMLSLLTALKRIHSFDLIHRDIKPSNFLYNRRLKRFALVDFGLAQKAPVALKPETSSHFQLATENLSDTTKDNGSAGIVKSSNVSDKAPGTPLTRRKRKLENVDENGCVSSPSKRRAVGSRVRLDFDAVSDVESPISNVESQSIHTEGTTSNTQMSVNTNSTGGVLKTSVQENSPLTRGVDHSEDSLNLPVDSGTKSNQAAKLRNSSTRISSSPVIGLSAAVITKHKSPRRALLTKRTLDAEKRGSVNPVDPAARKDQNRKISPDTNSNKDSKHKVGEVRSSKSLSEVDDDKSNAVKICDCFNKPTVCKICLARRSQTAPRAGTSGFRAPEVLMKYPDQTTSVDVWAAGVIYLSLLSGRYPFFKSSDDMTALAQILALLGTNSIKVAANAIGKNLITNASVEPVDLIEMCGRLREISRVSIKIRSASDWITAPDSAYQLLHRLLDPNPKTRITAEDALNHDFFSQSFES